MPSALDYITGIGSLVGTGASLGYNIWSTNENNRRNQRLMELQNKQNIAQWRRENAYNLPINQISRMEQAGLNPNLMYGEGAGSMLSAPSPQMQSSQGEAPQVDPLTSSQVALNLAKAKQIKDENNREEAKQPLTLRRLEVDVDEILQNISESESRVANNAAQTEYYGVLSDKGKEETNKLHQEFLYLRDSMQYRLQDIKETARKHGLESRKLRIELDSYREMLSKQLNLLDKQADLYIAESYKDYVSAKNDTYRSKVYGASVDYDRQFRNRELKFKFADLRNKRIELQGQLERWDDMTTNERLQIASGATTQLLDFGNDVYQSRRVTETSTSQRKVGNTTTTTKVKRKRAEKKPKIVRKLK